MKLVPTRRAQSITVSFPRRASLRGAIASMHRSAEEIESWLQSIGRRGWTWDETRKGLWNEERQLLITAQRIREELEAALSRGFVEAVVAGAEAGPHRAGGQ